MNLARLRLVTFDVTDTLLQFRMSIGKQYSEVGSMFGLHCNHRDLASNFKNHWYIMKKEYPNFGKSSLGWHKWWREIVHRTFKDTDVNADDKKLDRIATYLIDAYESPACWHLCYGASGLLSYLRNKGMPMGVMSNFDNRLHDVLVNTNLRHYFKFVLTSYDTGFEKPDKRMFERAMQIADVPNLKSCECLHIGDTVNLDYYGAVNAGWNAALIVAGNVGDLQRKHAEMKTENLFKNLSDLHRHFLQSDENKKH